MDHSKPSSPITDTAPSANAKPTCHQKKSSEDDKATHEKLKPAPIGYAFKGISFTVLGPDHPDFDEEF